MLRFAPLPRCELGADAPASKPNIVYIADDPGTDIAESKNLQADRPEEVARLSKLLDQYIANGRSTPGAKQANDVLIVLRKKGGKTKE